MTTDTIVAQATAPGRGGVGIIRVSGPLASQVALEVTGKTLKPRYAEYLPFKAKDGLELDQGIASTSQTHTRSLAKTYWSCKATAGLLSWTC